MSLEEIHKRRLAANGILKNTFWAAKELDHVHLSPDDLEKLNVQLSYFNIRGDGGGRAVNSGIQFFDPKPQHNMEILPDWTVNFHTPVDDGPTYDATTTESYGNFFKRYLSRPVDKPLIDFGPWGKVGRPKGLHDDGVHEYAFGRPGRYNWWWAGLWSTSETERPHQIIHILHAMLPTKDTDRTISRGELIPLIAFMVANMMLMKFKEHEVYPVLMLSFFGTKARVLQAYFDNQKLQVHKSEFVDIGTENNFLERKNDLARWMLGEPAGNTKVRPSRK